MKKEKWLLKEIDSWQKSALINERTAGILRDRYPIKKNVNLLVVSFSIIGALLIGAGIILILARNWQRFPIPIRATLAFLPLVVSQALAVFTVKTKYESLAWREAVSILLTASVFAAIAMVGQVFHLSGDYGTYILTCGLLSLPVIYILDAASPVLVYYWTALNWAALNHSPANAMILLGLFVLGAFFAFMKGKRGDARAAYMMWLTAVAGFVLILILGVMLECSLLLAVLCYFILLLSFDELPERLSTPFKVIGSLGGLVTAAILTYKEMWSYRESPVNPAGGIMIGVTLTAALFFAVRVFKRDRLKFLFLAALAFLGAARLMWAIFDLSFAPFDFILTALSNLILFSIGVGFIVHGVKNTALSQTNIGMVSVCELIIMRFFDSDLDFLWRGIVFLLLGIMFLAVNLKIVRAKKRSKQEERT